MIDQLTRAKLAYLDGDFVVDTLVNLWMNRIISGRERLRTYIEEDLVFAIADAGKHMANIGRYFTSNDHQALEKKIINSLSDEKVKIFIDGMLRGRLLEDRLISPFVKSGIINEYDAYNAIENIETWPTADVCHKELELFEGSYRYFLDIGRIYTPQRKSKKEEFNNIEFKTFKDKYIAMIETQTTMELKLMEYATTLPQTTNPVADSMEYNINDGPWDDLPF